MQQRFELSMDAAADEAAESGVNRRRFELLTRLAGEPPTPPETLELLRRGSIDEARARRALEQGPLRVEWFDAFLELRRVLLSPPELAGLQARGLIDDAQAGALAGRQGVALDDYARMVEARRAEPPLGEMLDLLNRGELDEGQVRQALERAGMRAEYVDPLLELRQQLPPVGDLIRFAVREVFTPETRRRFGLDEGFPAEFAAEARRRGLSEEWARAYWAAHWELPSPTQVFTMFHRGLVDRAALERYMVAADFMPFWREGLLGISYNVPGRIDLRRMYQRGVVDRRRVLRGYLDLGYNAADAENLTAFATLEQLDEERQLTKAELLTLYRERAMPREQVVELLDGLGYDEAQAELLLGLADYQRDRAYRTAAVAVVRSRFVDREIDERDATERLDLIGMPAEERERLLDLWTFQREESPARLTEAQARNAWRRGIIDEAGYRQQLELIGYPAPERDILVRLALPAEQQPAERERDLTRADVLRFYRYGQWTREEAAAELDRLGYAEAEVEALLVDVDRRYRGGG